MKLYYTVGSAPEDVQTNPILSLGCYKSSSQVQNGTFNGLFGDISMYSIKNYGGAKYIALVLKNTLATAVENIDIWFEYPTGCACVLQVAAVDMAVDGDGNYYMEHVPTQGSKPLYAEFEEADGEVNRINIGDLLVGGVLGIWIERDLSLEDIKNEQNAIYSVDINNPYYYNAVELTKQEEISIGISWDVVAP